LYNGSNASYVWYFKNQVKVQQIIFSIYLLAIRKTSFGYVPQQAWILGGTVRENILFGKSYDHNLYTETVKICALNRDLETFPNGDQTIIGDNGATLSGGQKQRINIARAVYSQSEILLMDDPLSALDTRISQYLFDACFMTYSKTKTKLLVTNQMHLLHQTDYIIVIDHGCVIQQGEFNLLMHQDGMFQGMMSSFNHISNIDQSNEQVKIIPNRRFSYLTNPIATNQHKQQSKPKLINDNMLRPTMIQLIQSYLTICGWKNAAIWFILLLLQNASLFISDRWLVAWSGHKLGLSQATYIYTYSVLIVIVIVVNMMGLAKAIKLSSSTATVIHNNTVEMLFKAQSSYYDTIAIGKIIDRFSKEQSVVDLLLAFGLNNSTYLFINFLCFICLMAVYNSMFAIVVPFVLLGFYKLQKYYRRSSREIKRLDTQSRAPVLSIFSTIMNGSTMIQAFDQQQTFMQKLFLQTDIINRVNFVSQCSVRWLGQYADVLATICIFTVVLVIIIQIDNIDVSLVSLSIVYAASIGQILIVIINSTIELENNMESIDVCIKFSKDILQEAPHETNIDEGLLGQGWPSYGMLQMKDVTLQYKSDSPAVLHHLSFDISPSCRVGIVGRSGAGKSSLVVALFRLVEITSGAIIIDNVNISKVGLGMLRSNMSIIPQDPVLFKGTVRSNMDPFTEYDDDIIWQALAEVNLKIFVESLPGKLFAVIGDSKGVTFSTGQKKSAMYSKSISQTTKDIGTR